MWFSKNSSPPGSAAAKPLGQAAKPRPSVIVTYKNRLNKLMNVDPETTKKKYIFKSTQLGNAFPAKRLAKCWKVKNPNKRLQSTYCPLRFPPFCWEPK